jgi:hypothetical protein
MALVNPNIAMSFRQPEIQAPNALAQYAQIQQIQSGQQAQELNRLQMQEYQRAREEEEGTRNFLRGKDLNAPDTRSGLAQFGKTGLAYSKLLQEQEAAALNAKNTQSQIDERDLGVRKRKLDFAYNAIGSAPTPEAAIAEVTRGVKDGVFDMKSATAEIQQIRNMTPEQYQQYRVQKVMGILEAKDKLGFMLPKITRQDTGREYTPIQDNPALPGYGLPVQGMAPIKKTPTIAESTAQGQLSLAQQKFAFEKSNPGYELKEGEDGTMYGVNKRTLQATPVTVGTAPVAAGAAPVAATPLKGKDSSKTAVSEQQASYNLGRVLTAAKQINEIGQKDPGAIQPGSAEALASSVGMSGTANAARNANRQIVFGAQRDALDALLYLATGAAYNKEQLEGQMAAYIPAYTDKPDAVAAKQARMADLIKSAKTRAGKAWTPEMESAMQSLTNPAAAAPAAPLGPQDKEALAWANSNPKDPRAAQIKQRLGVK